MTSLRKMAFSRPVMRHYDVFVRMERIVLKVDILIVCISFSFSSSSFCQAIIRFVEKALYI